MSTDPMSSETPLRNIQTIQSQRVGGGTPLVPRLFESSASECALLRISERPNFGFAGREQEAATS
jgi:hypothetical protein